jgi:hypothetical protein
VSCVTSFGSAPSFAAPPLPASACLSTTNPTRSTSAHSIRPRQTLCIYTVRRSIVNSILLKNIFSQVHEKFDFSPRSHACARVVRHQTRRTRMHENPLHQTRAFTALSRRRCVRASALYARASGCVPSCPTSRPRPLSRRESIHNRVQRCARAMQTLHDIHRASLERRAMRCARVCGARRRASRGRA